MNDKISFRVSDIQLEELKRAQEFIRPYSTVCICEKTPVGSKTPECQIAGSGTFVQSGNRYGILTAYHVAYTESNQLRFRAKVGLGVEMRENPHAFWLDLQHLRSHNVGTRISDEFGPDLIFWEILDKEKLGTIRSICSFWDISYIIRKDVVHSCLGAITAIVGLPEEVQEQTPEEAPTSQFDTVMGLPVQIYFGGAETYYKKNRYDYIDASAKSLLSGFALRWRFSEFAQLR